jgi:2-keto-4-pentenoate hydratase
MRRQQGADEPVFGFYLEGAGLPSGVEVKTEALIQPAFENELCLTLGSPLRGPGVTPAEARRAIASVAPALEIAERRGPFGVELAMDVADDIQAKHFVTGPESGPLAETLDLAAARVRVYVNGDLVDEARGSAVMGDPLRSLAWLANKLAEFGRELEAGQRILSGSFTRQYPVTRGDQVRAEFEPFGAVEARFL